MTSRRVIPPLAAVALAFGCSALALAAQPPADPKPAGQVEETAIPPEQVCLTNACAKPATNRPPAPTPDRPSNTALLPKMAAADYARLLEQQNQSTAGRPEGMTSPILGMTQVNNLKQAGLPMVSSIPAGMALDVRGGMWLADGGYLPPANTAVTAAGEFYAVSNTTTGGSTYGSSTTYQVNGNMITINKAILIGDQPMVMTNLTVRSGETATVRLPDGSIFQVTPTLRSVTSQEVQQKATMDKLMAKAMAERPKP